MPFATARSSMTWPIGVYSGPCALIAIARVTAAAVNASRSGVFGLTNAAPGRCSPIISINI